MLYFRINAIICSLVAFTLVTGCKKAKVQVAKSFLQDGKRNIGPNPEPSPDPEPPTYVGGDGALDPLCMQNDSPYDACVFLKNPVAQRGSPLAVSLRETSNLMAEQIFGVSISGLDSSGFLQNSSYRVMPSVGARLRATSDGKWKFPFSTGCVGTTCVADPNHSVGQLMAYYWLTYQEKEMRERTGSFFASARGILVDSHYPNLFNAFWDPSSKKIVLGVVEASDPRWPLNQFSQAAEVYLHEAGHANLTYSGGTGDALSASTHKFCTSAMDSLCCVNSDGCSGAINEGQADYHAAILFPNNTGLGESVVNSTGGLFECGLTRTVAANKDLTAPGSYSACNAAGVPGEIHVMGRVFASVFFEVRLKAGDKAEEVDKLFTNLLPALSSTDTFRSALAKTLVIDQNLYGGRYSAMFTAEWGKRLISAP